MIRSETMIAEAARKTPPTTRRPRGSPGTASQSLKTTSRVAAETATDWLATTQMNHVPFASATTGRSDRPSTALHGMT